MQEGTKFTIKMNSSTKEFLQIFCQYNMSKLRQFLVQKFLKSNKTGKKNH